MDHNELNNKISNVTINLAKETKVENGQDGNGNNNNEKENKNGNGNRSSSSESEASRPRQKVNGKCLIKKFRLTMVNQMKT